MLKELLFKNKVGNNAFWIIICSIVQSIISLVIGMITARYLGPSNYGVINYAASVAAFAIPIMGLGINNILVQELINNRDKEGEVLGSSLVLRGISAVFCFFGVLAFVMIANKSETETIVVCLLYSVMIFFQVFSVFNYWFQSKFKSKISSIITLAAFALVAFYKVFLLVSQKNIYWFASISALEYLVIAILLLIFYKIKKGSRLSFSASTAKNLFRKGKYYIIAELMVMVFQHTDRIMIKLMLGNDQNGYYSAAITCVGLAGFVFVAIIDSFRPMIFENKKISEEAYEKSLKLLYSIVFYFSLIYSLVMTIFSKYIVYLLYGNDYSPASNPLMIAVWYVSFSYFGSVRNIWLLAEGKYKNIIFINLFGAFTNVGLNFLFIPIMHIEGAALASLLTQFFTNFVLGFILPQLRDNNKIMFKSLNPKVLIDAIKERRVNNEG